jgi:hypothetical protein
MALEIKLKETLKNDSSLPEQRTVVNACFLRQKIGREKEKDK